MYEKVWKQRQNKKDLKGRSETKGDPGKVT